MEKKSLVKILQCPNCKNKLYVSKKFFRCKKCNFKLFLPSGKKITTANSSLGERIFDFPVLYNFKINHLKLPIDPHIKRKIILDIGCGSYQSRYNPNLAKIRVGIDPSANALKEADKIYPTSSHLVSTAEKLPFKNNSFDVVLLLFTLHHLSKKDWASAIKEAQRVTKKTIIIYDHILNESEVLSKIQLLYWKIFDGGETYPKEKDWTNTLRVFKIRFYRRVGSMFKHICFYQLEIKK